jgi:hypothetical protein
MGDGKTPHWSGVPKLSTSGLRVRATDETLEATQGATAVDGLRRQCQALFQVARLTDDDQRSSRVEQDDVPVGAAGA